MYKEIAIIAPTASGKTALSIKLAHKLNAVILSLDSLSVYKYIDIASAKPTVEERDGVLHFGIDIVEPNYKFDVTVFIDEYYKAKEYAKQNDKNLIIVGGTGFYLKTMIDGLSVSPNITKEVKIKVKKQLEDLPNAHRIIKALDEKYMRNIKENDKYRIEKAYEIYFGAGIIPSIYLNSNKPIPIIENIDIYEIETDPDILRQRIKQRTNIMINSGLIDEVITLEKKYTREPNSMSSIGIVEALDFLDSRVTRDKLAELISIHTAQLAKRQRTFNKSQFSNVTKMKLELLEDHILAKF